MTELISNSTISLHKKETVWFLEKGNANLFAIEKLGSEKGIRHHVALLESPIYLFSFDEENPDFEIVAITETDAVIQEMPLNQELMQKHLVQWIQILSTIEKKLPDREVTLFLPDQGKATIPHSTYFQTARILNPAKKGRIDWIVVDSGKVHLFNYFDPVTLESQDVYPLSHSVWMCAELDSEVTVTDFQDICHKGLLKKGFEKFIFFFLSNLKFSKRLSERLELHRLDQRKEKKAQDLDQIFNSMTDLLNVVEHLPPFFHDSLFQACQYIGKKQDIEIVFPEHLSDHKNRESLIKEICDASSARFRSVLLNGEWWREESGPLLAFYGNEQKPVVLLNLQPGKYTMVEPATGKKQKVTAKIAQSFRPVAYYLYRTFPDELKTGKEVLSWYCKKHHRDFWPLLIYGTLAALLGLFPSIASAVLFNIVIPDVMFPLLKEVSIALLISTFSTSLFFLFRTYILVRIQGLASHEIWTAFWDRLLKLPSQFFHRYTSGNLFNMMNSIEEIRILLSANGARAILSGIFSFFFFVMMISYSIRLTLIPLILFFLTASVTAVAIYQKMRILNTAMGIKGKINGSLVQMLGAISKLRIFGSETEGFSYWGSQFIRAKKIEMHAHHVESGVFIFNSILTYLGPTLLFAYTIVLKQEGEIPTWVFLSFNSAFLPFSVALLDLSNIIIELTSVFSLWKRAQVILEEPLEMTKKKEKPGKLIGNISLDRVFFRYNHSSPLILNDISIQVRPGEFVAIAGPSGSGKSTLLRMLLGFISPHSGGVYFDGKELNQLDLHSVRKQIGVVLQESGLISGSIYDNITCGGLYPKEHIEKAIHLSGLEEELEKFPMGLNTVISSGASTFSGGQKQKLLIARALVGMPKILIFDEATSFLDNRSQDQISRNIEKLEITRIVSAHRLSTIRKADRIYVLEQGKVIQMGTFDTLAKEPGLFQNMLTRQQI